MIRKIFLWLIILILIVPGLYFYLGKFVNFVSHSKEIEEHLTEEENLELNRQAVIDFLSENVFKLPPKKPASDETRQINKFWFVKNSFKELYVEYKDNYQIKKRTLIEVIGGPREEKGFEDRSLDLINSIVVQCLEPPEKWGYYWKPKKESCFISPQEAVNKYGLENVQKVNRALEWIGQFKDEEDLNAPFRAVYLINAYFDLENGDWQLKEGKDKLVDKSLDLYEYSCHRQSSGWSIGWTKID